jgi:hypothetical protein
MPEEETSEIEVEEVATGNGTAMKVFTAIASGLATAAIIWSFTNARGQGESDAQLDAVVAEVALRAEAIHQVPVIANDVKHNGQRIERMDAANAEAHAAILDQMKTDKREILSAIRNGH